MKRLLALALCVCFPLLVALGGTGCGGKEDKPRPAVKQEKVDVVINPLPELATLNKKGDTKIAITVTAKADEELPMSIKETDKVKGSGKIDKGKDSGELTITTEEGFKTDTTKLTVQIAETVKTNYASAELKIKKVE